jgi:hypothetical protein
MVLNLDSGFEGDFSDDCEHDFISRLERHLVTLRDFNVNWSREIPFVVSNE